MNATPRQRLLTFKTGGWVLLVTAVVCIALVVWAVAPALLKEQPPGDGHNVETYGFDLTTLLVPRETLVPIMRHRDMVPVMHDPSHVEGSDIARINEQERGKYLVPRDRVVGVAVNGETRAYPVTVLTVHEVIHDTLGGVPIAVTYNWLTDSPRVFDRRLHGEVFDFGTSGLASNGNGLLYDTRPSSDAAPAEPAAAIEAVADRPEESAAHESSLFSQLTGIAVAGPAAEAGRRLTPIPAQLVSWSLWLEMHPETTVIERDPAFHRRYRKATPDDYFRSPLLPPFPVEPVPEQHDLLKWKDRVVVVDAGNQQRRVYSMRMIRERAIESDARQGEWIDRLGPVHLHFTFDADTNTAYVQADLADSIDITHAFWFAWHAADRTLLR